MIVFYFEFTRQSSVNACEACGAWWTGYQKTQTWYNVYSIYQFTSLLTFQTSDNDVVIDSRVDLTS